MAYIEWLRVKRAMFWVLIFLGVTLLSAIILRITLGDLATTTSFGSSESLDSTVKTMGPDGKMRTVSHTISHHPSVTSTRILADGSKQTITTDPVDNSIVVTTYNGYFRGTNVDIVTPISDTDGQHTTSQTTSQNFHLVTVSRVTAPFDADGYHFNVTTPMEYVKIRTHAAFPTWVFFIGATITGLIVATVLGIAFASQNDGHLEIAFTRPVAREREALQAIGVDIAGILLIMLMQGIVGVLALALWVFPHLTLGTDDARMMLLEVLLPVAWYAFTLAITSSLKRGYGALAGILWPASLVVMAFGMKQINESVVAQTIYRIANSVSHIIPLFYGNAHADSAGAAMLTVDRVIPDLNMRLLILAGLAVAYFAIAVVQWRRVEA